MEPSLLEKIHAEVVAWFHHHATYEKVVNTDNTEAAHADLRGRLAKHLPATPVETTAPETIYQPDGQQITHA